MDMNATPAADPVRPSVVFDLVVLDTDDLPRLSEFYCALLDWRETERSEDWITIRGDGGGPGMAFQLAPDHRPPTWPEGEVPQQSHLDLNVTDLDATGEFAVSLGARPAPRLPGQPDSFVVYLDPSGHPFCLCRSS